MSPRMPYLERVLSELLLEGPFRITAELSQEGLGPLQMENRRLRGTRLAKCAPWVGAGAGTRGGPPGYPLPAAPLSSRPTALHLSPPVLLRSSCHVTLEKLKVHNMRICSKETKGLNVRPKLIKL